MKLGSLELRAEASRADCHRWNGKTLQLSSIDPIRSWRRYVWTSNGALPLNLQSFATSGELNLTQLQEELGIRDIVVIGYDQVPSAFFEWRDHTPYRRQNDDSLFQTHLLNFNLLSPQSETDLWTGVSFSEWWPKVTGQYEIKSSLTYSQPIQLGERHTWMPKLHSFIYRNKTHFFQFRRWSTIRCHEVAWGAYGWPFVLIQ